MTVQRAALYQWSLLGDRRLCWCAIGLSGAGTELVDPRLQSMKCGTRYLGLITCKRDVMICKPNDFARYRVTYYLLTPECSSTHNNKIIYKIVERTIRNAIKVVAYYLRLLDYYTLMYYFKLFSILIEILILKYYILSIKMYFLSTVFNFLFIKC